VKLKTLKKMAGRTFLGRALAVILVAAPLVSCEDRLRDVVGRDGDLLVIRGLLIDGHVFPETQFHLAPSDRCDDFHWHRPVGEAISIGTPGPDRTVVCHNGNPQRRIDPDLGGCGFGRLNDRPPLEWRVSEDCFFAWEAFFR
jgi:hypothetical protein